MMINTRDLELLQKNARIFSHLTECNSHIFGEPFLENDFLYYFDGNTVTLVTPMVKGEMNSDNVNDVISNIIKNHDPESLILWGEMPELDLEPRDGYKLYSKKQDIYRRELVFRTSDFKPTKKFKNYLNKAKDNGLDLVKVKHPFYKAEYMKLLADTHTDMLGIRPLSYYSIYPHLQNLNYFEVRKDGKLVSINLVIESLPNFVCFAEIGYDKSVDRISGISKAMLIDHYRDIAKYISWGGSASEGIYKYKLEVLGHIPIGFYDNLMWHEYYKTDRQDWWLERMGRTIK